MTSVHAERRHIPDPDSQGRMPLGFARAVAEEVADLLSPYCRRIAIAGSIRRKKAWVKDIEILAVPEAQEVRNLLGEVTTHQNLLDRAMSWLLRCDYREGGDLISGGVFHKRANKGGQFAYGPKNKLLIHAPTGMSVDLFSTEVRCWGMAMMVRTGGAMFNKKMMSRFQELGMKGHAYGGVTDVDGVHRDCPDEARVFGLLGWEYIEPEDRP